VESIVERINSGTTEPNKESRLFEIRNKIRTRSEDTDKSLMMLCNGDVVQYKELKRSTMYEYITKLDNYAQIVAPKEDIMKGLKLKVKPK